VYNVTVIKSCKEICMNNISASQDMYVVKQSPTYSKIISRA
jgi:hypothetical protein